MRPLIGRYKRRALCADRRWASHGTHEFFRERAQITKRLRREKGFNAVAVEASWLDAYRINRYVHGMGDGQTAIESLFGFERFPIWMWRNADVLDFISRLGDYNDNLPSGTLKAGFYGLDLYLYSLYGSVQAVLQYLARVDPEAAKRARHRYSCGEAASWALRESRLARAIGVIYRPQIKCISHYWSVRRNT